jgi:hypothetical protein
MGQGGHLASSQVAPRLYAPMLFRLYASRLACICDGRVAVFIRLEASTERNN